MRFLSLITVLFGFICSNASAEETIPQWIMIPEESSITFTAVQNHAPVTGSFKKFNADIHFDANQLDKSTVKAAIDIGSVSADYEEVEKNLKAEEWFAVSHFPSAVFTARALRYIEDNRFEADGMLTIRDITLPINLPFTLDIKNQDGSDIATMLSTITLKRTLFGVGQGEWKDTSAVEDDVKVKITLKAKKEVATDTEENKE